MSDELDALRQAMLTGDYAEALALIDEMDEMSRDDKINKIESYMRVLLVHLIKQAAEKRSTRSWEASMREALASIVSSNKRRKSGGRYLDDETLRESLGEAWPRALDRASMEAFEGIYTADQLAVMVNREALLEQAFQQIIEAS
jgi:hypothetical protein